MIPERQKVRPEDMTEEERRRMLQEVEELFAEREETRRRIGTMDVAALVRRARGTED
jgi:hypothetical protein